LNKETYDWTTNPYIERQKNIISALEDQKKKTQDSIKINKINAEIKKAADNITKAENYEKNKKKSKGISESVKDEVSFWKDQYNLNVKPVVEKLFTEREDLPPFKEGKNKIVKLVDNTCGNIKRKTKEAINFCKKKPKAIMEDLFNERKDLPHFKEGKNKIVKFIDDTCGNIKKIAKNTAKAWNQGNFYDEVYKRSKERSYKFDRMVNKRIENENKKKKLKSKEKKSNNMNPDNEFMYQRRRREKAEEKQPSFLEAVQFGLRNAKNYFFRPKKIKKTE
jgi:hypothetical protein